MYSNILYLSAAIQLLGELILVLYVTFKYQNALQKSEGKSDR